MAFRRNDFFYYEAGSIAAHTYAERVHCKILPGTAYHLPSAESCKWANLSWKINVENWKVTWAILLN